MEKMSEEYMLRYVVVVAVFGLLTIVAILVMVVYATPVRIDVSLMSAYGEVSMKASVPLGFALEMLEDDGEWCLD